MTLLYCHCEEYKRRSNLEVGQALNRAGAGQGIQPTKKNNTGGDKLHPYANIQKIRTVPFGPSLQFPK